MKTAITRGVGGSIIDCELTYAPRQHIDAHKAIEQQRAYEESLKRLGVRVVSLPYNAELPDSTFVQDTAIVVEELAVIARMGATTRRRETELMTAVLSSFRDLKFINHNGTLEGGDVIMVGRTFYVGISSRTNREGVEQLRDILKPFDYQVKGVEVKGCLHLSTACSYVGRQTMLVNGSWVDTSQIGEFDVIEVPPAEPWAANTVVVDDVVLMPDRYPLTRALLEGRGFRVQTVDISELEKAEAGLSCLSILFDN